MIQKSTRSALSDGSPGLSATENTHHHRTRAVRELAFEIAELALSPEGVPDAEDWEIAELLFASSVPNENMRAPHGAFSVSYGDFLFVSAVN